MELLFMTITFLLTLGAAWLIRYKLYVEPERKNKKLG